MMAADGDMQLDSTTARRVSRVLAGFAALSCVYMMAMRGRFILGGGLILLSAATAALFGTALRDRWPRAAPAAGRLASLGVLITSCHDVAAYVASPRISMAILAGGVLQVLAWCVASATRAPMRPSQRPHAYARVVVVLVVFVLALAAGVFVRDAMSSMIAPDTRSYWTTPAELFRRTPGVAPIRTPQYSVMFAAVQLFGGSGTALVIVQLTARALLAAAVAALLSGSSLLAALLVGCLIALDPVSASTGAAFLTESAYASALVFSAVLAVAQLTGPARWRRPLLLAAGGFAIGTALLVRPSSIAFVVPVAVIYGVAMRSLAAGVLAGVGYAGSALAIALFNYLKSGLLVVVATGVYVAFPLFIHQLFDPKNGPASSRIARELTACYPGIDFNSVRLANANEFVHTKLLPCTVASDRRNQQEVDRLFSAVYREAFLSRPLVFTWRLMQEGLRFLATTVAYYAQGVAGYNQAVKVHEACMEPTPARFVGYDAALLKFVCPIDPPDPDRISRVLALASRMRILYQPYLYAYDPRVLLPAPLESPAPELTGLAAILFFAVATVYARAPYRPLILAAALIILANAAITALGQVTLDRYVAPLSPLFLIVGGLLSVSVAQDLLTLIASALPRTIGDRVAPFV